jgi:phosphoribosylanthranilate isomerase
MSGAAVAYAADRPVGVKICGITRVEDGLAALAAGADALGIVLAEQSKRRVGLAMAGPLLADLRAAAGRDFLAVAVLGDLDPGTARQLVDVTGFDRVQFHAAGGWRAYWSCCEAFGTGPAQAWAAVRVRDAGSFENFDRVACEAFVLDAWDHSRFGGTGTTFDWSLAAPFARLHRVILAGGLDPSNVVQAVQAVRPWMVDVSSGVESAPGRKDPALVRAFVEAVRHA